MNKITGAWDNDINVKILSKKCSFEILQFGFYKLIMHPFRKFRKHILYICVDTKYSVQDGNVYRIPESYQPTIINCFQTPTSRARCMNELWIGDIQGRKERGSVNVASLPVWS